ncbi:SDR family NAD(P)-dependent oxidoreductase [Rickettsiales bacterium]|nr:SDR family NAD(P)-dependent oxidoreductase [Rickettsiales bacterium]
MKKDKVAWVTGGGTGIGAELVKILVDNGWNVSISGRREDKLRQIKKYNKEKISLFKLDITSEISCKNIAMKIMKRFNKIDLIILNAAAYNPGHLNFNNLRKIKDVMDTNLMGQMNCISSILPSMKKRNSGHIVFVSSPAGFKGLPNAGIYGITKSALTFLAESMFLELLKTEIKVQVIHPGFIKTPMTDKNNFPMPFLMTSQKAAKRIYEKLFSSDFEIYFPKRLIIPMKILSILPYRIYFFIMSKILNNAVKLPPK